MNKLAKRVLAFMLMVCMLAAMVPAVVSAEAPVGAVVYDFELDQNSNLKWYDANNVTTFYGFGQTTLPQGNAGQIKSLDDYYANGTILWSFPHALTEEGKVASELSFGSSVENPIQWGGPHYKNSTTADKDWTGLRVATYSQGAATGWNAFLLKAPDVGTYNITVEYTNYGGSSNNTGIYLLPYTAAMQEKVETDVEAWNADVSAIVAEGDAADSYLGKFSSWIANGSTPVPGQIKDLGEFDVNIEVDEYLMIVSAPAGKSTYLQNVTFTPVAEEEIPAEVIERNYSIAGTVSSTIVLNKDGVTDSVEALYNAGTIDWSYLGTNSDDNEVQLQTGYLYNQNVYLDTSGAGNYEQHYEAYKVRAPGEGMYDISISVYKPTDVKTMAWCSIYVAEYTEGMDPESVVAVANKIGVCHPENNEGNKGLHTYEIGAYNFASVDKEYIIVLKADLNDENLKPNTDYSALEEGNELKKNAHMTNNFYTCAFSMEAQVAAPTFVPKAYIGATPYATVTAAAAAAQSGETVKLAVDYIGNIDLPAGVSLDLAGHTWTVSNATTTNALEYITDSVGTGKLVTKNIELYGDNNGKLPLLDNGAYTMADYDLAVTANDYEANGEATRFWFKLSLDNAAAYDLIASGNSGLTIGVELDWGAAEGLDVTFDKGNGAEAFAAEWAAAAKNNANIWLYVDITGLDGLTNDLTVKPVLNVNGQSSLYTGSLVYDIG